MSDDDARSEALRAAAEAVVERLAQLAATLDPDERAVLAALLAPALTEDEVAGFGADAAVQLPHEVFDAVRARSLRIVDG